MKVLSFVKRDPVLCASFLAAVISAFFVPPSAEYLGYIDFRVLCLLLSLMLVVAGLRSAGVFDFLINRLLRLVRDTRTLCAVLTGFCFFFSMLITNDVALITFVPLAVMMLQDKPKTLLRVVVLQTVAANLGSMLTPLGNPQNLYLYSLSGMTIGEFLGVMAVPTLASFVLLAFSLLLIKREPVAAERQAQMGRTWPWLLLFALCLLAVVRVVHYLPVLLVVVLASAVLDRRLLAQADYALLLTFVFFFIFVGNIKNIPSVSTALSQLVSGREMTCGILLSQVISNVPAAMLLSGFTEDCRALLIGVNLGGLGTIIASMASLISYKLYAAADGAKKGAYMGFFTLLNLAFLAVLWLAALVL